MAGLHSETVIELSQQLNRVVFNRPRLNPFPHIGFMLTMEMTEKPSAYNRLRQ
jgi:hypothetical protein